jgi:hypothetical protein
MGARFNNKGTELKTERKCNQEFKVNGPREKKAGV